MLLIISLIFYIAVVLFLFFIFYGSLFSCLAGGQGRNADALALYFGEDPARCPFEQGNF